MVSKIKMFLKEVNNNMDEKLIEIDKKIVERLKRNIIIQESKNLKTKNLNDQQMVSWIKKRIEEEVQCCLNQ